MPPRIHWLTARATDEAGVTITSDAIQVSLYAEPSVAPYVDVIEPPDGSSFVSGKPVRLRARVQLSDHNFASVEFYAGTNLLGAVAQPPYELTLTNLADGLHIICAQTKDLKGRIGSGVRGTIRVGQAVLTEPKRTAQGFEMSVTGNLIAKVNTVQASQNLREWSPLRTNTPTVNQWLFVDPTASNELFRFYRVLVEP